MKSRHALTVFLAVVLVPIARGFAGASVKASVAATATSTNAATRDILEGR